jgi:hypothetical protein
MMRFLVVGVSCAALACSSTRPVVRELPESYQDVFAVPVPAYGAPLDEALVASHAGDTSELDRLFRENLSSELREKLTHDRHLDLIAAAIGQVAHETNRSPSAMLLQWMMWKRGIAGREYGFYWWWQTSNEGPRVKALNARLAKHAREMKTTVPLSYGLVRFHAANRKDVQAIVFARRPFEVLTPVAKTVDGSELVVRGKLAKAYRKPQFVLDLDGATSASVAVSGWDFEAKLPAPTTPGQHYLTFADSNATLLMLPFYVGEVESPSPPAIVTDPLPDPSDISGWSAMTLARFNAYRVERGLPPFVADPVLDEVATAHARRFANDDDAARNEGLTDDLRARGYEIEGLVQTSARFASLAEMLWLEVANPLARRHLNKKGAVKVGFGFAKREKDMVAVQYFLSAASLQ